MDWCCHYGLNLLFKVVFCWITYVVDYMNENLVNTKQTLEYRHQYQTNSEMPLGLGQSSAISLMLPRHYVLEQVHV